MQVTNGFNLVVQAVFFPVLSATCLLHRRGRYGWSKLFGILSVFAERNDGFGRTQTFAETA